MATKSINPSGKPRTVTPHPDSVRVGREMRKLSEEAGMIRDSLSKMIGVANGFDPHEDPASFKHRLQSVCGRSRTILKGMARIRESLAELKDLV